MLQCVLKCVDSYRRELRQPPVDPRRVVCLDDSIGGVEGALILIFEADPQFPILIAKAAPQQRARRREGKPLYQIEYENLEALETSGLNLSRRTTPAPLVRWQEAGLLITLQSALRGPLLKNIPACRLLSAQQLATTLESVFGWWQRFEECFGLERRGLDDPNYREQVLGPVESFQQRFVTDQDERGFLQRRFEDLRSLAGRELPFTVQHGDFCPANIVLQPEGIGVFDWELPLRRQLPLFDLFHFFASVRYPFRGLRGESSHYHSFLEVFWGENYFNRALRHYLDRFCSLLAIERDLVADLFLLSLIRIANLKYQALLEIHGSDREPSGAAPDSEQKLPSLWPAMGGADQDVPFARIQSGVFQNLRHVVRHGLPDFLQGN
jgi:hypothetical protein